MKKLIFLIFLFFLLSSFNTQFNYIDPTGTYKLNNIYKKDGDDEYGYSGLIQVKKINQKKIVMTFEVNKGAPSYNSGSFVDTLDYKENKAIFRDNKFDLTCKVIFDFRRKGINVIQETEDNNWGCGFGHGVVADGFYKKISSKTPILKVPLTDENLEK